MEVPGRRRVKAGVSELADVAREAGGFGLEVGVGACWHFAAEEVELGGGGERHADLAADSAEPEELLIASGGAHAAGAGEVDEHVRFEAANLDGKLKELPYVARAGGVAHVGVDEAGVVEHGGCGWGFGGDGEVGQEPALGVRKGV